MELLSIKIQTLPITLKTKCSIMLYKQVQLGENFNLQMLFVTNCFCSLILLALRGAARTFYH